jgi:hypothetical protein
MEVPDDGGGSIPAGVCVPTPSDLEGAVYNLLARIKELEDKVAQQAATNVTADRLSDLAQQVGWVTDIVYNGIGGFTRTEAGTLIPPPGVSLNTLGWELYNTCTGGYEPFPMVVMDENGVLQWGATTTGGLCGAKVEEWDDAAANSGTQDYGFISHLLAVGSTSGVRGMTILTNSLSGRDYYFEIQVSRAGLYMVQSQHNAEGLFVGPNTMADGIEIAVNGVAKYGVADVVNVPDTSGTPALVREPMSAGGVLVLAANDIVRTRNGASIMVSDVFNAQMSLVRISN